MTDPSMKERKRAKASAIDGSSDGARPLQFTQLDLNRTLKAAKAADVPVKIEIEVGKMTAIMDRNLMIEGARGCASV